MSKPCVKLQYKVENNLFTKIDGPNIVKFGIQFTDYPPMVSVKEEYLIYDMVSMISAIGGTMGLCIGLSFKDIYLNMLILFQLGTTYMKKRCRRRRRKSKRKNLTFLRK